MAHRESPHYTIGEFTNLNHGRTLLPSSLAAIFANYNMPPCCLKEPYNNPFNAAFAQYQNVDRSSLVQRAASHAKHGDERILTDIKNAFSCVNAGRDGSVLAAGSISQMIMPESKIDDIAKLFFDTMIQSPSTTMINSYLKVLFEIRRLDLLEDKIRLSFCKLVKKTFQEPVVLPDTAVLDGETRTLQHRTTTCKIYASLYAFKYNQDVASLSGPNKKFSKMENLRNELLDPLLKDVLNTESSMSSREHSLMCLTECLAILVPSGKFPFLKEADFQRVLNQVNNDKSFKMRLRLGLEDYLTKQS
jgi:hypothetical protein